MSNKLRTTLQNKSEVRVGNYWIIDGEIISDSEDKRDLEPVTDGFGMIHAVPRVHNDSWKKLKLINKGKYDTYPRGSVYIMGNKTFIDIPSSANNEKYLTKLGKEFNITNIKDCGISMSDERNGSYTPEGEYKGQGWYKKLNPIT